MEEKINTQKVDAVVSTVTDTHTNVENPMKKIVINNFIGGIAWAMGISVGASLVLAVFGFILGKINLIPIIGTFIIRVNEFIAQNSHAFRNY